MVLVHYKSARAHYAFLQFTSFDYESFHHFFECVFVHVCENTKNKMVKNTLSAEVLDQFPSLNEKKLLCCYPISFVSLCLW